MWLKILALLSSFVVLAASQSVQKAADDYAYQLDTFRTSYSTYQVKLDTFQRSGTFQAQDELVNAAKKMLSDRAMVWWSYFQALKVQVSEQDGFPKDQEATLFSSLQQTQDQIKTHQASVSASLTREVLLKQATDFNQEADSFNSLSYNTLAQLKLAQMRAATQALVALEAKVKAAVTVQVLDTTTRETRLRGFEELTNLLGQINDGITQAEKTAVNYQSENGDKTGYDQVVKALDTPYQNLTRAKELIHELSAGVEL